MTTARSFEGRDTEVLMIAMRKALIPIALVGAFLALPWGGAAGTASAQTISVTSANPSSGEQGTTNLDVTITGKGFKSGAKAAFYQTRTTNPGGLTVKSTRYVSATQLVANIDIADTAALSSFDIQVLNADGRTGKGTELFSVVSKKNAPPAYVWSVTFEDVTGTEPVFASGTLTHGSPVMVLVQYNTPTGSPAYSRFFVEVSTGYAQWIGFRGLTLHSSTLEPGLTPTCQYPRFDPVNGHALLTGEYAADWNGCALDFLSGEAPIGHRHPDGSYYTWVSMEFRGWFQFDAMEIGSTTTVAQGVSLSPAVQTKPCGTTYAGLLGQPTDPDPDATLVVTRSDENTWRVEARGPMVINERGVPTVFKPGPKGIVTCSGNEWGRTIVTEPITVVSTWHRQ